MLGAPGLAALARELHDAVDLGARERWPALLERIDELQAEIDVRVTEYMQKASSEEGTAG